jgi:hypothetical protein
MTSQKTDTTVRTSNPMGDDLINENYMGESCNTHATDGKYNILAEKREEMTIIRGP